MAKPLKPKSIDLEMSKRKQHGSIFQASKEKLPPYNVLHRITSSLWCDETVPFSLYEVTMKTPHIIDVLIINGKAITRGWFPDVEQSPDPYILMRIPSTPNGIKRTKPATNPKDPVWNEHFYFFVDSHASNYLELTLMDSKFIRDKNMGVVKIFLDRLEINDVPLSKEMTFLNGARVYLRIWRRESADAPHMRSGQSLSDDEIVYLEKRRHFVMESLDRLLAPIEPDDQKQQLAAETDSRSSTMTAREKAKGSLQQSSPTQMTQHHQSLDRVSPTSVQETPIVAILGSGGGFRACAGFAGAMLGLQKVGIMDCASYVAGISGSAWYLSFLFSQPNAHRKGPMGFESLLRERMCGGWKNLLLPRSLYRFVSAMAKKAAAGQPISFPDLFGGLIGEKLLGQECSAKPLSAQRHYFEYGEAPLPVYTCVHINRDVSPSVFQEWLDFTPYDVWLSKYALSMPTELFGCKWFCGIVIRKFQETPISYLMGLWSSALSVLFKRLIWTRCKKAIIKETAGPDKMALGELASYRAYVEGYPPMNNDTGSSDISIEARTSDEVSTSDEDPEVLERLAKEAQLAEEQVAKAKKEAMAGRYSRSLKKISKTKSIMSEGSIKGSLKGSFKGSLKGSFKGSFRDSKNARSSEELEAAERLEAIKVRLQIRKFRKFLLSEKERKEAVQRSFWRRMLDSLMSEGVWDSRAGRAGLIFNPLRGLVLKPGFAKDAVETTVTPRDNEPMKGAYVMSDPRAKRWFLADAGLALNLPFPPLMRPQRAVDVYIVFDFSTRFSDEASPFDHLLLAEHWARVRRLRFPPVSASVRKYLLQPPRECYFFEDREDPLCPMVLYFPLVNNLFRKFRSPGVFRTSMLDKKFGDFPIFSDPDDTYSITNLFYDQQAFDRLTGLMQFNVEQSAPALRALMEAAVRRKRSLLPPACQELERLKREEEEEAAKLEKKRKKEARRKRREMKKQKMQEAKRIMMAERPSMLRRRIEAEVEMRQKRLEEMMRSDRGNPALARALRGAAMHAERQDPKALITQLMWLAYNSARTLVVRSRRRLGLEHASSMIPAVPSRFLPKLGSGAPPPPTPPDVASRLSSIRTSIQRGIQNRSRSASGSPASTRAASGRGSVRSGMDSRPGESGIQQSTRTSTISTRSRSSSRPEGSNVPDSGASMMGSRPGESHFGGAASRIPSFMNSKPGQSHVFAGSGSRIPSAMSSRPGESHASAASGSGIPNYPSSRTGGGSNMSGVPDSPPKSISRKTSNISKPPI